VTKREWAQFFGKPISLIENIATQVEADILILGAAARDFHLADTEVKIIRQTNDLDCAVAVKGWEIFSELMKKIQLLDEFSKDPQKRKHRVMYGQMPIDIIPFGGVADGQGNITWPPENEAEMNVIGIDDALKTANLWEIDNKKVKIANLEVLIGLKFISWDDNKNLRKKDASDAIFMIRNYESMRPGIGERLFEEPLYKLMEKFEHDQDKAISAHIGQLTAKCFSARTTAHLTQILERECELEEESPLLVNSLSGSVIGTETESKEIIENYKAYLYGLND